MHIKFESILRVLCTHYKLLAYCIPKNTYSFYTQNGRLLNKLSFDMKGVLYKKLTPYKAMYFTLSDIS